jgi:hypothetical protein
MGMAISSSHRQTLPLPDMAHNLCLALPASCAGSYISWEIEHWLDGPIDGASCCRSTAVP